MNPAKEQKVDTHEHQIKKLLDQLAEVTRQKQHLETVINGIIVSKSWRITKPIRQFSVLVRSVKNLLRFKKYSYELKTGRGIVKGTDGVFQIQGVTPTIELKDRKPTTNFPSGWVEISGDLSSNRDLIIFLLYYRLGPGFDGAHRVYLPLGSGSKTLVRLPAGIKEFRLDPFETDLSFSLPAVSIRELGSIQLFLRVLAKQLQGVVRNPRMGFAKGQKAWAVFRTSGVAGLRMKLFKENSVQSYDEWIKKYDTINAQDRIKNSRPLQTTLCVSADLNFNADL